MPKQQVSTYLLGVDDPRAGRLIASSLERKGNGHAQCYQLPFKLSQNTCVGGWLFGWLVQPLLTFRVSACWRRRTRTCCSFVCLSVLVGCLPFVLLYDGISFESTSGYAAASVLPVQSVCLVVHLPQRESLGAVVVRHLIPFKEYILNSCVQRNKCYFSGIENFIKN